MLFSLDYSSSDEEEVECDSNGFGSGSAADPSPVPIFCTHAEGLQLHLSDKSKTGYLRVEAQGNRFLALRYCGNRRFRLGTYASAVQAAVAVARDIANSEAGSSVEKTGKHEGDGDEQVEQQQTRPGDAPSTAGAATAAHVTSVLSSSEDDEVAPPRHVLNEPITPALPNAHVVLDVEAKFDVKASFEALIQQAFDAEYELAQGSHDEKAEAAREQVCLKVAELFHAAPSHAKESAGGTNAADPRTTLVLARPKRTSAVLERANAAKIQKPNAVDGAFGTAELAAADQASAEVRAFLDSAGLSCYAEAFESNGFDDLTFLRDLPRAQLNELLTGEHLCMKAGHAMKFSDYLLQRGRPN